MRVVARGISMGRDGLALPESTVGFETGRVALAVAETGQRPTVLSLLLSGRMRPATGTVTIDGEADARALSDRVALVDAPEVSEPQGDLRFDRVVREELVFSGRSSSRATVHEVVEGAGGTPWLRAPLDEVPAGVRVRVLAELAAFRRGVEGVVLCAPDRHGGDPREWLEVALDLARRDLAVLVVVGAAAAEVAAPLVPAELRAAAPDVVDEVDELSRDDTRLNGPAHGTAGVDQGATGPAEAEHSEPGETGPTRADLSEPGDTDLDDLLQGELAPAAVVDEDLIADARPTSAGAPGTPPAHPRHAAESARHLGTPADATAFTAAPTGAPAPADAAAATDAPGPDAPTASVIEPESKARP